jgi:signal transduction histidine kinase
LSHGGSIRVKSELGRGSTFIINFKLPKLNEDKNYQTM